MNDLKIDIVIPWVDSNDLVWRELKSQYTPKTTVEDDFREIRYRDWDNLQYVFRSIEEFAPWVNRIHFITCGHLPKWLNVNHPKLNIVRHDDYIPSEYLPTFSSHVIELYMNRIEGLSEHFIYFNDDIFLLRHVKPTDFFRNGLPCDANIASLIVPSLTNFTPIVFKTVGYINGNFEKRAMIKAHPKKWFCFRYGIRGLIRNLLFIPWNDYTGFYNHHLAVSYLKTTLDEVWEKEADALIETSRHRFRNNNDVNQYIFRYWQLASGVFYPYSIHGRYFKIKKNNDEIIRYIRRHKGRMICINDDDFDGDFDEIKTAINEALYQLLPNKSSYEV